MPDMPKPKPKRDYKHNIKLLQLLTTSFHLKNEIISLCVSQTQTDVLFIPIVLSCCLYLSIYIVMVFM